MRPTHWIKNLFVLSPLVFSQNLFHPQLFILAFLAFVLFCGVSGSIYILNDVNDRFEDSTHPTKANRPIASGKLSLQAAVIAALILQGTCLICGWFISLRFMVILIAYLLLNVFYTFFLKKIVILDVMLIAAGFILRVLAGSAVIGIQTSPWLVICTGVLALFLGFGKRRHELILLKNTAAGNSKTPSYYSSVFLDQMISVVTASTLISYALYTVSEETVAKFQTGNLIYTIPFVVYGIFRYLYLLYQKESEGDPTRIIITDWPLIANLILWLLAVVLIVYT
jgi:4-hydroxybenzoate polyprenyltransferase